MSSHHLSHQEHISNHHTCHTLQEFPKEIQKQRNLRGGVVVTGVVVASVEVVGTTGLAFAGVI